VKHKDDDYWDAILNEIDMDFIPLEYINTVVVKFRDGKVWEIDVEKSNRDRETPKPSGWWNGPVEESPGSPMARLAG
jgi:hypothetical protein